MARAEAALWRTGAQRARGNRQLSNLVPSLLTMDPPPPADPQPHTGGRSSCGPPQGLDQVETDESRQRNRGEQLVGTCRGVRIWAANGVQSCCRAAATGVHLNAQGHARGAEDTRQISSTRHAPHGWSSKVWLQQAVASSASSRHSRCLAKQLAQASACHASRIC